MHSVNVYLDTNVFIEMYETRSVASTLIWDTVGNAKVSGVHFISSELTLAEILVKPIKSAHSSKNWQQVIDYRQALSDKPGFQKIVPVTSDILYSAASIRALTKGVKLPDAIHLATAIIHKCNFFLSNDRELAGKCLNAVSSFPIRHFVHFDDLAGYIFKLE